MALSNSSSMEVYWNRVAGAADTLTAVATPPPLPRTAGKAADATGKTGARFSHYLTRPLLQFGPILFGLLVTAVLGYAWMVREEGYWTAEKGIGYWLGIAGSVIMLVLILYPLRKRFRILHGLGRVASWFRIHMVLGILGPLLIVLHCNFKLGSLNSRLALFTMLTVVASGIAGRYIYSQIHRGLYGKRAEARDILDDVDALKQQIGLDTQDNAGVFSELEVFNARASVLPASALGGLWMAITIGSRTRRERRRMTRLVDAAVAAQGLRQSWSRRQRRDRMKLVHGHLGTYFAAIRKAQKLALFERLFALWHVLHMPLFVLLAVTVVMHIVAVHQY
ncbi:MAG: pyridine nucleotide-disulfide oxidoreductase [Hyphomicrobium sp.]|nr:pyridine nucleotide-disulfide oxidoreductase [Hyphomicrobium sp.]